MCIRYPVESGHQLSGGIRYPVKIAIRYIPTISRVQFGIQHVRYSGGCGWNLFHGKTYFAILSTPLMQTLNAILVETGSD